MSTPLTPYGEWLILRILLLENRLHQRNAPALLQQLKFADEAICTISTKSACLKLKEKK